VLNLGLRDQRVVVVAVERPEVQVAGLGEEVVAALEVGADCGVVGGRCLCRLHVKHFTLLASHCQVLYTRGVADVIKQLANQGKRRAKGEAMRDDALAEIAELARRAYADGHSKKAIYDAAGISRPALDTMLKRKR
jgi:hypothetical protein